MKQFENDPSRTLERHARRWAGRSLRDDKVIPSMIDAIKALLGEDKALAATPGGSEDPNEDPGPA